MNIQEKKLVEAFLDRSNITQHNKAVELLFYGRRAVDSKTGREITIEFDVTRSIKNAVSICFSGSQYSGRHKEVYDTFVSLFNDYLSKLKPETFFEIQDLQNWMFRVAKNYANSHRKAINDILGIEDNTVGFDQKMDVGIIEEPRQDSRQTSSGTTPAAKKIPDSEDDSSSHYEHSSKWAEDLVEEYISRIPHLYYREILQAVDLHGMSMEDFAEEQGKKLTAIHNDHKRAMSALIQAALPDIRWRAPKLYDSFKVFLDSKEIVVLGKFFGGEKVDDVAELVKAYVKLLKVSKRENKAMEKSERKEAREKRKSEKE